MGKRAVIPTWILAAVLATLAACGPPDLSPLPPNSFAFGVFGDGPYPARENGRFRRVIQDANRADLTWFLHVGDILGSPCSDETFADRLALFTTIRHPVVYTPGDNEWTDCHREAAGGYPPLERLAELRRVFFPEPGRTIGATTMPVQSQRQDSGFAEFVENVRWRRGGFVFATIHLVGSDNATRPFPGRGAEDDAEVVRRTAAALAWLDGTFALARTEGLRGVVLAMHGDPGFEQSPQVRPGYEAFVERLETLVKAFAGPVLLVHGDSHIQRVDHPLRDRDTGQPLPNFTRLETFGSPDIGWIRVVIDSAAGRVILYEPRRQPEWRRR